MGIDFDSHLYACSIGFVVYQNTVFTPLNTSEIILLVAKISVYVCAVFFCCVECSCISNDIQYSHIRL